MRFDDLLPYILPRARGCAEIMVAFNARLAAIELCRKALVWRDYQLPILTIADKTSYAYAPNSAYSVTKLISLTLDGTDVTVLDPLRGQQLVQANAVSNYAYGTSNGFELQPAQTVGLAIVTYAALVPGLNSNSLPDSFNRYAEAIAHGALARILTTKGRDYYDPAGAIENRQAWEDDIGNAISDADSGFARSTQRTAKVWF